MTEKKQPLDFNQYGMKDPDYREDDVRGNRPADEKQVLRPMNAVTSSGHRVGAVEQHPDPKPSSRSGQKVTGEVDDKKR
jgi:hypothetical protein